jgi:purine-cytosine permease-like protein
MVVSSFAIGALANPVFGLGFVDGLLTILFINILGILPVCFFSTFGPRFGMRQMILSRFYFGYYGVKVGMLLYSTWRNGWPNGNVQSLSSIASPAWDGPQSMSLLAPN